MTEPVKDVFSRGGLYEPYVGRWSRLVAVEFLAWLDLPAGLTWLDVGCGTGAVSRTILDRAAPREIIGIDMSEGYIAYAREHVGDERARFQVGDAQNLPFDTTAFDAAVSGLALNFVPAPHQAAAEMTRVTRSGGTVAVYVWDYAGTMEFMRYFWDAAAALFSEARDLDEGSRFPLCRPEPLRSLFVDAGLAQVEVRPIDIPTRFRDFDDYWSPFLGGQGAAPSYAATLTEEQRGDLREAIRSVLPFAADGSLHLKARAWAVRGSHE